MFVKPNHSCCFRAKAEYCVTVMVSSNEFIWSIGYFSWTIHTTNSSPVASKLNNGVRQSVETLHLLQSTSPFYCQYLQHKIGMLVDSSFCNLPKNQWNLFQPWKNKNKKNKKKQDQQDVWSWEKSMLSRLNNIHVRNYPWQV